MTVPAATSNARPAKAGPPTKHQLALMIWLAVFPTLTVLNLALGEWLATLSPVQRTFVLATAAVPIVIYGLMPLLHKLRVRLLSRAALSARTTQGSGCRSTPTQAGPDMSGRGWGRQRPGTRYPPPKVPGRASDRILNTSAVGSAIRLVFHLGGSSHRDLTTKLGWYVIADAVAALALRDVRPAVADTLRAGWRLTLEVRAQLRLLGLGAESVSCAEMVAQTEAALTVTVRAAPFA